MKKTLNFLLMLCLPFVVFAQPANDNCAGAIDLSAVLTDPAVTDCQTVVAGDPPITTINGALDATDSGVDPGAGCSTQGADMWYTWTATTPALYWQYQNAGGDPGIYVYSGACGALTEIDCLNTFSNGTLTGWTVGDNLIIQIHDFGTTTGVALDFCLNPFTPPPPPPGETCADPIPYPGNVATGSCADGTGIVNIDFSVFNDVGTTPSCDGVGNIDVWMTWTAPVITAAGDPIDLNFDDGNGFPNDCGIGLTFYETDCTTEASNCLNNTSGLVTGLTQGTNYVIVLWDDTAGATSCDVCLSLACSLPVITATAVCQYGDAGNFYVDVDFPNMGIGNTAYTVDVGGPQANVTAAGTYTYGPFPIGTPVDVTITGVDDAGCVFVLTGLESDCVCDPLTVDATADATNYCPGDPAVNLNANLGDVIPGPFIDYTVTNDPPGSCTAVPDDPADCVDLALGDDAGSGPIPLGFNFDFFGTTYTDVCVGSNGYVTFTCVDETDLSEDPFPNANDPNAIIALFWDDLNPTDAASGIICTYPSTIGGQTCFVVDYQGIAHFGGGETVTGQIIICPDGSMTINCIDCQADNGGDTAGQGIENEDGTVAFFDPAHPAGTTTGAASTQNCVTFTPNYAPPSPCTFVAWVTDPTDIPGTTIATTPATTDSPAATTTYYAMVDCGFGPVCTDMETVTVDLALCAVACPTVALTDDTQTTCDGSPTTALTDWQAAVAGANPATDPDGTFTGIFYSSVNLGANTTTAPDGDVSGVTGVHSGADNCLTEDQIVYAYQGCDSTVPADGLTDSYELVGTLTLTVYPQVQNAVVINDSGGCCPSVTVECGTYSVANDYDANMATPDCSAETGSGNIEFTITNPNAPVGGGGPLTVWSEDFTGGGAGWTLNTSIGTNGAISNVWEVSDAEGGGIAPGGCGVAGNGNNSLFVTTTLFPGAGAAYFDGLGAPGCADPTCESAVQVSSPSIDLSSCSGYTLSFNYIAGGAAGDMATLLYDDGGGQTAIGVMLPTNTCGGGQGEWAAYSVALPASADFNPNFQILFDWVNSCDCNGADPSFAIDDIQITCNQPGGVDPPCQEYVVSVPYNCTVVCPTPVVTDGNADICDGGLGTEIADWQAAVEAANPQGGVNDPDGTLTSWFYSSVVVDGVIVTQPDGVTPTGLNSDPTGCNTEDQVVYAYIGCDQDGDLTTTETYILAGTYTLTVYPTPQAPTIIRDDLVCNYTLTANCDGSAGNVVDVLAPAGITTPQAPGFAGMNVNFDVTNGGPGGCLMSYQVFQPDCPGSCAAQPATFCPE